MTDQPFTLIPFSSPAMPAVTIRGTISRLHHSLVLHYALAGNLQEIILPAPSPQLNRKDELWRSTCFEYFIAIKGHPQYWEFNMSPSGDWNVYRMDAYRRIGFREETSIERLPFKTQKEANTFVLSAVVDLSPIFQLDEILEVGITAVIQTKDGEETYWALAHPAPHADFHLRESFILALAPQTHPLGQSAPGD